MSGGAAALRLELLHLLRTRGIRWGLILVMGAGVWAIWQGLGGARTHVEGVAANEALHRDQLSYLLDLYPAETPVGEVLYYMRFPAGQEPEPRAALALGQRDVHPYNLRVGLLALEGQLYDSELGNPRSLAAGNLDLAFVLVILLPLLVVALMYDLVSGEKERGRWPLLLLQAGSAPRVLRVKLAARFLLVLVPAIALLLLGVAWVEAPLDGVTLRMGSVAVLHLVFWFALALAVARLDRSSEFNALALAGCWVGLALAGPAALNLANAVLHPVPEALELTVLQRQGYHDSWDRPVSETMEAFYGDYPRFRDSPVPEEGFSWGWYYAMNHRGDQAAREAAIRYRESLVARERWARRWGNLFPPLAAGLALERLAGTDLKTQVRYQDSVRGFHEALKAHFHPYVFREATVSEMEWDAVPRFPSPGSVRTLTASGGSGSPAPDRVRP